MFVFSVNDNYFAFEIDKVKEVVELRKFVSVPGSLEYIRGAINYKGTLYCIIDTALFFKLNQCSVSDCDIIILADKEFKVGFLAEQIAGAVNVTELKKGVRAKGPEDEFIKGYCNLNGNKVKLIDTKKVFKIIENNVYDNNLNL
jgi:purine-binding chemotaxis protein CheW